MKDTQYIVIGVDPGSSSGAIAIIQDGNLRIFGMDKATEQQIERFISDIHSERNYNTKVFAIIEKVSAMPKQGVTSTFTFGANYGFLRGCLVANRIPFRDYRPQEWQKHYSMVKKKTEEQTAWKKRLLNVAQNLYPNSSVPLYAADAVLLSHFAKDLLFETKTEKL